MDHAGIEMALLEAQDAPTLVRLYTLAANDAEAHQDIDAASFFMTHAFIFALEANLPEAQELNRRLAARGRSQLLDF